MTAARQIGAEKDRTNTTLEEAAHRIVDAARGLPKHLFCQPDDRMQDNWSATHALREIPHHHAL